MTSGHAAQKYVAGRGSGAMVRKIDERVRLFQSFKYLFVVFMSLVISVSHPIYAVEEI